jgi:hypothetical protein
MGGLVATETYRVKFTVSNYKKGTVRAIVGSTGNGTLRSANGTYIEDIVCSGALNFYIQGDSNFDGSIDDISIEIQTVSTGSEYVTINYEEARYDDIKVSFVNKYGAIQQLWMLGKFNVKVTAKAQDYKRNVLTSKTTYDTTRHQMHQLNRNGEVSFNCNTGWVLEEDNDMFIEMMFSEQVWIRVNKSELGVGWLPKNSTTWIVPVVLTSQTMDIKNRRNDKLINYSFGFKSAHDWINTVR